MQLTELLNVLETIAPLRMAESWDNVGLLVGDPAQSVTRAMLTIDYTAEVAAEARAAGCDVIIAYHPPIFEPLKRISGSSLIHDAIRRGVAIYAPHTALDIADGGTNDMLADVLGLAERRPLRLTPEKATRYKLVVFVPADAADAVGTALFDAGAGLIGNYTCCSFRSPGVGTFFGQEGASPTIGRAGKLERVDELRLETIVPIDRIEPVLRALRASHPYEEPAFDLVQLAPPPVARGQGRIGAFPAPVDRAALIDRIKQQLGISALLVAGPASGQVSRAACCAGACGNLLDDALAQKADLYLTGEVRHHDALKAAQRGMTVVCALHSNSERNVLARLATRISAALPNLDILQSSQDRDPFVIR